MGKGVENEKVIINVMIRNEIIILMFVKMFMIKECSSEKFR
jgi:hypothetical protein